ncbi:hypothetical protein DIPPA_10419 [Diplonema papillatum]|nr:hypothetical protein DIPPA_10419 [Diplonema papillatum]
MQNAAPSMYVRVKRKKQTIFLHCEPRQTVLQLKEKVAAITGTPASDQRLQLGKQNLEDQSSLADCGIYPVDTGTELFLAYRIVSDSGDRWEDVEGTREGGSSDKPEQAAA